MLIKSRGVQSTLRLQIDSQGYAKDTKRLQIETKQGI